MRGMSIFINSLGREVDDMIDGMPHQKEFFMAINISVVAALNHSGKQTIRNLKLGKLGIKWKFDNPVAVKFLEKYGNFEKLSPYRGEITRTTKKEIRRIVTKGAEKNMTYSQMARLIRDQGEHGVFSLARGKLIAVQELGAGYREGAKVAISQLKAKYPERIVAKRWITVGDGDVRTTHLQNQKDRWIDSDQAFSGTGEQYAPSADFNCRCTFEQQILAPGKSISDINT